MPCAPVAVSDGTQAYSQQLSPPLPSVKPTQLDPWLLQVCPHSLSPLLSEPVKLFRFSGSRSIHAEKFADVGGAGGETEHGG